MPRARCPVCQKYFEYADVRTHKWFPLCSGRCRLLDLAGWFNEQYRVSTPLDDASGAQRQDSNRQEEGDGS